jgi:hypothetical protein
VSCDRFSALRLHTSLVPAQRAVRAEASAFTREGDEKVKPAFIAKGPGKAVGDDTAREILAKIMFHWD